MSSNRLARLQAKLARIDARIANIEKAYPTICQYKQYNHAFGTVSTAYQEFGPVANEYHRLLNTKDELEDEIDDLTGNGGGSTSVAAFGNPRTSNNA